MKKAAILPTIAAIALLGSAGTAAASTTITKGVFSPSHNGSTASTAPQQASCNVANRACASPASARTLPSSASAIASNASEVTMGRFQATFVNDEIAIADTPDDNEVL
ncbi:MAG: hypothetical protein AAF500_02805 [Myxococcota bacterium]